MEQKLAAHLGVRVEDLSHVTPIGKCDNQDVYAFGYWAEGCYIHGIVLHNGTSFGSMKYVYDRNVVPNTNTKGSPMSEPTKVYVNVNRQEALRHGINGTESPVLVTLDVSAMPQEDRDLVARAYSQDGTSLKQLYYLEWATDGVGVKNTLLTVIDPTEEGVLAAFADVRREIAAGFAVAAERKAAKVAEQAAKVNEWLARDTADLLFQPNDRFYFRTDARLGNDYEDRYPAWKVTSTPLNDYDHRKDEVAAKVAAAEVIAEERNEALVQAILQERAAVEADRKQWIANHGSRRLQRLAAEGIEHEKTYQTERTKWDEASLQRQVSTELPGWYQAKGKVEPVADVSLRSLAILDAARVMRPDAKLGRDNGKIVAWCEYQGRIMCWPAEEVAHA